MTIQYSEKLKTLKNLIEKTIKSINENKLDLIKETKLNEKEIEDIKKIQKIK